MGPVPIGGIEMTNPALSREGVEAAIYAAEANLSAALRRLEAAEAEIDRANTQLDIAYALRDRKATGEDGAS